MQRRKEVALTGRRRGRSRVMINMLLATLLAMAVAAVGTIAPSPTEPTREAAASILEPGAVPVAASFQKTQAQLNEFYAAKGGTITARHKEVIEAQLFAEDEIMAGDIVAARARIDAIYDKYPISNPAAWQGLGDPPNVWAGANNPVAYGGLRMLDEVTRVALSSPPATSTPLRMTIIMPKCSTGLQPANKEMTATKPLYGQFSQRQLENNYEVQRRWFKNFQLYVWAITGGQRHLELEFFRWDECIEIGFDAPNLALSNKFWGSDMARVPREVHDRSDMYTFIYPVPTDYVEGLRFLGGQGSFEGKMLMMGPDTYLPKNPTIKGNSDVEHRLGGSYVVQHEFMHYFFLKLWPEFNLEPSDHAWFNPANWPADFDGVRSWEADYYANALHRRFLGSSNPPAQALNKAANQRQPVAQPIPGPNWQGCANEGQTCSVGGPSMVRYGANGRYTFGNASDSFACSNATFADPAPGIAKTCSVVPMAGAPCAVEGGRCSFSGSKQVRYGANGRYVSRTFTGGAACTNQAFGTDPAPGVSKSCSLVGSTWNPCAAEGVSCNFSGEAEVRYGAGGRHVTQTFTNGAVCSASAFGRDPAPGVVKSCSYRLLANESTPPGWTACASEGGRCSFAGWAQVRYGANGRFVTKTAAGGVNCTNGEFGRDPAPGVVKSCWY